MREPGEGRLPVTALIVEDDPLWVKIFSHVLERMVDTVRHATTVDGAVDLWRSIAPAVLFVDLRLGRENGLDFVRIVRETDRSVPILMITGDDSQQAAVRAINLGVTRFVPKPVGAEELARIADEVLAGYRLAEERRARHRYFEALVEQSVDMIMVLDARGVCTYAGPSVYRTLGVDQRVEFRAVDFVVDDDQETWNQAWSAALAAPGAITETEVRVHGREEEVRRLEVRIRNLLAGDTVAGVVVNARDVTVERDTLERLEEAERTLQAQLDAGERRYRTLFDLLPVGVSSFDEDGSLIRHNAAAMETLGIDTNTTPADSVVDRGDGDNVIYVDANSRISQSGRLTGSRALRNGETVRDEIVTLRRADGTERFLSVSVAPYQLPDGKAGVVAVFPDITERVRREREQKKLVRRVERTAEELSLVNEWLREIAQEEDPVDRLPSLLNTAGRLRSIRNIGVYRYAREAGALFLLGTMRESTWPRSVEDGMVDFGELVHEQLLVRRADLSERNIPDGAQVDAGRSTGTGQSTDESTRRFLVVPMRNRGVLEGVMVLDSSEGYGRLVRNLAGALAGTIGLMLQKQRDTLARRHAESEQRTNEKYRLRMERLPAMGNMASAIGHEINQPLQSIKIISDSTLYWTESKGNAVDADAVTDALRRISERADWAANIVRSMKLVFSNPDGIGAETVDIQSIVDQSLAAVEEDRAAADVDVKVLIEPDARAVRFTKLHLTQLLVNLLRNAFRAMLREKTDDPLVTVRSRLVDERVRLEVEDNGPGVSDSIKDRVFEPFYTTAERTENMGLGLYVVHTLARAFNFEVRIEDAQSGGARFVLEERREPAPESVQLEPDDGTLPEA